MHEYTLIVASMSPSGRVAAAYPVRVALRNSLEAVDEWAEANNAFVLLVFEGHVRAAVGWGA